MVAGGIGFKKICALKSTLMPTFFHRDRSSNHNDVGSRKRIFDWIFDFQVNVADFQLWIYNFGRQKIWSFSKKSLLKPINKNGHHYGIGWYSKKCIIFRRIVSGSLINNQKKIRNSSPNFSGSCQIQFRLKLSFFINLPDINIDIRFY